MAPRSGEKYPAYANGAFVLSKGKDPAMRYEIYRRCLDLGRPISAVRRNPRAIDTLPADRVELGRDLLPHFQAASFAHSGRAKARPSTEY